MTVAHSTASGESIFMPATCLMRSAATCDRSARKSSEPEDSLSARPMISVPLSHRGGWQVTGRLGVRPWSALQGRNKPGSTLLVCGSRSVKRYRMRRAMLRPLISIAMRSARAAILAAGTRSRLPEAMSH